MRYDVHEDYCVSVTARWRRLQAGGGTEFASESGSANHWANALPRHSASAVEDATRGAIVSPECYNPSVDNSTLGSMGKK